jgi:tripartite-type tricarboxylate transporter receptor subunit TctC
VVDQLHQLITQAAASPVIADRLQREGAEPMQMSPAGFSKVLGQELTNWRSMIASSPMKQH